MLFPRPFNIVCTTDGFVGKHYLMRSLGCTPTNKFVADLGLVRDMRYCFQKLKSSVLMFPEAGYSFADVVKTTVLLADIADFKAMNGVYAEHFSEPFPARVCYQVAALPLGAKVEIDAVATK